MAGKADLVNQVNDNTSGNRNDYLTKGDVEQIVSATFDAISDSLAAGDEVSIPGFGKFHVQHQAAREGRNPSTGETMQIAAKDVPKFRAGAALKQAVA